MSEFELSLAAELYRTGMDLFLAGKPIEEASALSARSGWKDAKRMQIKTEKAL